MVEGLCVIIIMVELNCLFIFFRWCNKFWVFLEFNVLVGLFVKIIVGLWMNVWVVVVCCCWLLEILFGYLFFRL